MQEIDTTAPLLQTQLTSGDTITGRSGIVLFESGVGEDRRISISICMPNGRLIGALMDDATFDTFCEMITPIVERRNAELKTEAYGGHVQPVRTLQ